MQFACDSGRLQMVITDLTIVVLTKAGSYAELCCYCQMQNAFYCALDLKP